ncbi:hypothetical protein C882_1025 [Caenispirillum salinarum AK4]|uniref:YetF C-terminal domain-containing protein n=1 Tax=Caenispirillum salinarum AK4 TaxID=1238182 RepID=K9HIK5_9PROT|nr:YetF domain-containing protein [Caenispirillum salinarum]EKV28451.1 hypothetical protein C882_1025 [Caenispirillum salinarum AK4]
MDPQSLDWLHRLIGSGADTITWWQMSIRAAVLFLIGLIYVRLADRRAFGKLGAFDIILAIIVGSNVSRAITATAPFVPTVAATGVLVLMHGLFTHIASRSHAFGMVIKGREKQLMKDGVLDRRAMSVSGVTVGDMREAARLKGKSDLAPFKDAYLERNGSISLISRD